MDFMRTLLVYMSATLTLAVQNTAAPKVTPTPSPAPEETAVVETVETPEPGEEVIFTTVDGVRYRYIITTRETLFPTEVDRMIDAQDNWDLTLFTCFIGGRTRCTLRCTRVDP